MVRSTEDILENFEEETESYLLAFCNRYKIDDLSKIDIKNTILELQKEYSN